DRAARLGRLLIERRHLRRPGRDGRIRQGPDLALRAPDHHDGSGARCARSRGEPDRRAGAQPGRAVVWHPVRADSAGDPHQPARGDGGPRQPSPHHGAGLELRGPDHRAERVPDLPAVLRIATLLRQMALADTFQQIVDALPDDWTDLELDLRIFDERRYVDAAVLLVTCNAQPYSKSDWHWRLLVAHRFGHAAAVPAVH